MNEVSNNKIDFVFLKSVIIFLNNFFY